MISKLILINLLIIAILLIFKSAVLIIHSDLVYIKANVSWNGETVVLRRHALFDAYLKKFNKSYDREEYDKRSTYFMVSLQEISRLNAEDDNVYGLTIFSDMSMEELPRGLSQARNFKECRVRYRNCKKESFKPSTLKVDAAIPDKFDWRDQGVISPVLDQKNCNGCWAFSIVGVMESMAAIRDKSTYTRRSIQELIDCSLDNAGCAGGNVVGALDFLCNNNKAIVTEAQYPLKLFNGVCRDVGGDGLRIKNFWYKCGMNEDDILHLIANHGPVTAVVNAAPWIHYLGGIIQRSCVRSHDGESMDHVIQIVGYDKTGSVPYYVIRNSWGHNFGDRGYVKLAVYGNVCGIAEEVGYLNVY